MIKDTQIQALRAEAAQAQDWCTVELCELALNGDTDSRRKVEAIIDEATREEEYQEEQAWLSRGRRDPDDFDESRGGFDSA